MKLIERIPKIGWFLIGIIVGTLMCFETICLVIYGVI